MKVIALHIWIREKRRDVTKRIVVTPSSQNIQSMKLDIAKTIDPLKKRIKYYYVIMVVRKPNGKNGYRTVIPTQLFSA